MWRFRTILLINRLGEARRRDFSLLFFFFFLSHPISAVDVSFGVYDMSGCLVRRRVCNRMGAGVGRNIANCCKKRLLYPTVLTAVCVGVALATFISSDIFLLWRRREDELP